MAAESDPACPGSLAANSGTEQRMGASGGGSQLNRWCCREMVPSACTAWIRGVAGRLNRMETVPKNPKSAQSTESLDGSCLSNDVSDGELVVNADDDEQTECDDDGDDAQERATSSTCSSVR